MYNKEQLTERVHSLKELRRQAEDLAERIKVLEDDLKNEMTSRNEYELEGDDWKISWKEVVSNRFSQSTFKAAHPDLFESYLKESVSRRFLLG